MITLNLNEHELADLDRRRGTQSREDWIRGVGELLGERGLRWRAEG